MDINQVVNSAKAVMTRPGEHFSSVKKDKGLKTPFWYYAAITLLGTALGLLGTLLFASAVTGLMESLVGESQSLAEAGGIAVVLPFAVLGYLVSLGLSFLWAGILHVWIKIFGGKGVYARSYQLLAYSQTPNALLNWLPLGGIVAWFWGLYLLIVGTNKLHDMTKRKATLIFVIPAVLLTVGAIVAVAIPLLLLRPLIEAGTFS